MGLICLFCFIAIFITPSYGDELNYHYPLAQQISFKQIVDPHSNYSSAYMPLPYLIGNIFLRMFNSLLTLRILNYLIFLLMIYFFYLLVKKYSEDYLLLTLLAFLNPYFLMSSFVYYMYNWGLLFALMGFYFYSVKKLNIITDLFLALAVLSQQWMLVLVLAIILHEWTLFLERKINIGYLIKSTMVKCVFLTPAVYLFIKWGGLTHPNFFSHFLRPSFEHLSAVLSHIGFIMFFPILVNFRSFFIKKNIFLLFLLPLFWLTIPAHVSLSGPYQISGYFSHMAMKINFYLNIPYKFTMFFFILPGLLFLISMLKKNENDGLRVLIYALFGLFTALVASVRLTTAHIYLCIPFLLLLFHSDIAKLKKLKILMLVQYLFISCLFIFYFVFFRSRGIMF